MIAFLFLVGFVGAYFWQILGCVLLFLAVRGGRDAWDRYREEAEAWEAELAATAQRADREHALILAGNEAGIYGQYQPTKI